MALKMFTELIKISFSTKYLHLLSSMIFPSIFGIN